MTPYGKTKPSSGKLNPFSLDGFMFILSLKHIIVNFRGSGGFRSPAAFTTAARDIELREGS